MPPAGMPVQAQAGRAKGGVCSAQKEEPASLLGKAAETLGALN